MSDGTAYPQARHRAPPARPNPAALVESKRSNAAIPVVIVLAGVGLYFGRYTFLIPGLLGLLLFVTGFSFLSTRVNPLSAHFYLSRKPSWLAVGIVFLGALILLADAYALFERTLGSFGLHA